MRLLTETLIEKYKDNLFAIAFHICKNQADADDVVQDTFIQYHTTDRQFDSEQHIKAWLIRVAINKSKNLMTTFWRRHSENLDDYIENLPFETKESENIFEQVMRLKEKYRIVIHLFYYEEYSIREISEILNVSESNVKVRLTRGRKMLKQLLKEEWDDDDK